MLQLWSLEGILEIETGRFLRVLAAHLTVAPITRGPPAFAPVSASPRARCRPAAKGTDSQGWRVRVWAWRCQARLPHRRRWRAAGRAPHSLKRRKYDPRAAKGVARRTLTPSGTQQPGRGSSSRRRQPSGLDWGLLKKKPGTGIFTRRSPILPSNTA